MIHWFGDLISKIQNQKPWYHVNGGMIDSASLQKHPPRSWGCLGAWICRSTVKTWKRGLKDQHHIYLSI